MPKWIKPGIVGAALGAIAMAIVGFTWMGWVTGDKAASMARASADAAVVEALVPVCVARAQMDPDTGPKLQKLSAVTSKWDRRSFVEEAGWAKMPGVDTSNRNLADACALALKDLAGA